MRKFGKHLYPRVLVVVESPNKVSALEAALGRNCKVLATSGHFRRIESIDAIDFASMTVRWSVDPEKEWVIENIGAAIDDIDELVLATDDDQEGEAIAWHVLDELRTRRPMDGIRVSRMVFHEVTGAAIARGFLQRSTPWHGSRRATAALTRALIDKVLGETLTQRLSEGMHERGYRGQYPMGRVRAALLELIERDRAALHSEYLVAADIEFGDTILSAVLSELPSGFEPMYLSTSDHALGLVKELQESKVDKTVVDVTRFSLGAGKTSSTAEVLIRAYEEHGVSPEKTQLLLQQLYEGA